MAVIKSRKIGAYAGMAAWAANKHKDAMEAYEAYTLS